MSGMEQSSCKSEEKCHEERLLELPDLQHRLEMLLSELHEKRFQHSVNQRELSKQMMKGNEQERMLECERRSLTGLQLQLDLATQAVRRKELDAEVAVQKANRLEVQLTLANQEITVLREECCKLELQILERTQDISGLSEKVKKLTNFKDSCHGLQEKVNNFTAMADKEITSLKSEVSVLASDVEKSCMKSVDFETAMEHYYCLRKQQESEFEKARKVIIKEQCSKDELEKQLKNHKCNNSATQLEAKILELRNKSTALEKRLSSEKAISNQLKEILSKAVQSQENLQLLESEANSKLRKTEAKYAASSAIEEVMKQDICNLKDELNHLKLISKKAELEEKGVQTEEIFGQPDEGSTPVRDGPSEKLSESALSVQEVRKQFQSTIAASGDDWSKYLSAFKTTNQNTN